MSELTPSRRRASLSGGIATALLWAFCAASVSFSVACVAKVPASNRPAPIGKELVDLDRAHRDGLLGDEEYATLRVQLLRNFERIGQTTVEPEFPYRDGGAR